MILFSALLLAGCATSGRVRPKLGYEIFCASYGDDGGPARGCVSYEVESRKPDHLRILKRIYDGKRFEEVAMQKPNGWHWIELREIPTD